MALKRAFDRLPETSEFDPFRTLDCGEVSSRQIPSMLSIHDFHEPWGQAGQLDEWIQRTPQIIVRDFISLQDNKHGSLQMHVSIRY